MQTESVLGVVLSRDMAGTSVDVLSWGSHDLAFNCEANPDHFLKTDDDSIQHVLKSLDGTQTKLCMRTCSKEQFDRYAQMGVTMFLDQSEMYAEPKV